MTNYEILFSIRTKFFFVSRIEEEEEKEKTWNVFQGRKFQYANEILLN